VFCFCAFVLLALFHLHVCDLNCCSRRLGLARTRSLQHFLIFLTPDHLQATVSISVFFFDGSPANVLQRQVKPQSQNAQHKEKKKKKQQSKGSEFMCCETCTAQSNMCSTYIRKAQSNQNERLQIIKRRWISSSITVCIIWLWLKY